MKLLSLNKTSFAFQREKPGLGFWQKSLRDLSWISMGDSPSLVGLDIGSTAIKVVQLGQSHQSLILERFGVHQIPAGVDRDDLQNQGNWTSHAIRELFRMCDIQQKNVAVSLSGPSVITKRIDVPSMNLHELEGYLTWKGSRHVPFDMDEVYWDYHPIPTQTPGKAGSEIGSVFVFAAKRGAVENLQHVVCEAGLRPVVVDVTVVALANMYLMTQSARTDGLILLVHIEGLQLSMSVLSQKKVIWMRNATLSLHSYDETFSQGRTVVEEIIGEIKRAIEFLAENESSQPIKKIMMYGDFGDFIDFQDRIREDLYLNSERGNPFHGIKLGSISTQNQQARERVALAAIGVGLAGRKRGDRLFELICPYLKEQEF